MRAIAFALVLAGCSAVGDAPLGDFPDASGADCRVAVTFHPATPIAGPSTTVRVTAQVLDVSGVIGYEWRVQLDGRRIDVTPAQADNSEIDFAAPDPGTYDVFLDITGAPVGCPTFVRTIDVRPPGAVRERVRLRVVPPGGVAPVLEQRRDIDGGPSVSFGVISLESGSMVNAMVRGPSGGVPAYLRFAPDGAPDAVVEAFADAAGLVTTRLLAQPHTVLVIPSVAGIAPRRIAGWSPSAGGARDHLDIGAGSTITGTVRDPANAPLAGATVKLSIDGVPSTVATTAGDGHFTVRAATGTVVVVDVTPPGTSGLPRLSATSQAFDLGAGLEVRYAANLVRRNLAGISVLRQGTPVANAKLMVVGLLAEAGTVTAGATATATGEVRIAVSAGPAGTLPSMLVPAAALSAVVTVTAGDLAVAALDTTDSVPATMDAPPMLPIAPFIRGPGGVGLRGAVLDAVPIGALAMAATPALHVTAGANAAVTASLASGGHYDLRFRDPAGRAALLVVTDRVAATVAPEYRLRDAVVITGTLMLGGIQPLADASIQILCDECNGIDRAKPIAEAVSDAAGVFTLAVPDPGTR